MEKSQALSDVTDNLHDDLSACIQGFIPQKIISVVETKGREMKRSRVGKTNRNDWLGAVE
jgi:hypothetical protein